MFLILLFETQITSTKPLYSLKLKNTILTNFLLIKKTIEQHGRVNSKEIILQSYYTPSSDIPVKPSVVILNLNVLPVLHFGEFTILNYLICPFLQS